MALIQGEIYATSITHATLNNFTLTTYSASRDNGDQIRSPLGHQSSLTVGSKEMA